MIERTKRLRVVVALVAVLILVVSLVGTAIVIASDDDADDAPQTIDSSPTLQLSRTSSTGFGSGAAVGSAGYQLEGSLDQTTDQGVVIDPSGSKATESQVRTLLGALGMTSITLTPVTGGWTATGRAAGQKAAFALDEKAGNLWQYGRGDLADCLTVQPGADPNGSVSCSAPASPSGGAGPGRAALVKEAKGLFTLVGVTPGTGLKANDDGNGATYLDVPLTVEGLPVVDVNLSVGADADGIVSALGLLNPTYTTAGKYPLVSARTGFDQLAAAPVPEIAPSCPAGKTCTPKPATVTAARLAWLTAQDAGRTVLVPAWQFEVDGFYGPAVVAVAPQYLASTEGSAPETDSGSGSGSSEGSAELAPVESAPAP